MRVDEDSCLGIAPRLPLGAFGCKDVIADTVALLMSRIGLIDLNSWPRR